MVSFESKKKIRMEGNNFLLYILYFLYSSKRQIVLNNIFYVIYSFHIFIINQRKGFELLYYFSRSHSITSKITAHLSNVFLF